MNEPDQKLMNELISEITLMEGDRWNYAQTHDQRKKFFAMLNEVGIKNRPLRIYMVRIWTGNPNIQSTNDISSFKMSVMINKNADKQTGGISLSGLIFLTRLTSYVKANFVLDEGDVDEARVAADLSNL